MCGNRGRSFRYPLFRYCGASIAVNYRDSMIGKAKYYLKTDDLTDILQFVRE